jgi:hypothetical protein
MRLDIAKRKADDKTFSETMATYWPKLTAIVTAISEATTFSVSRHATARFSPERMHQPLSNVQLPDAVITDVIYGLSHHLGDGQPRYINYRDLSVQQLGSVYWKTLGYDHGNPS